MNKHSRARQFLPFNALKGYYKLIKEIENNTQKHHETKKLTDEEINLTLTNLKKLQEVEITFKNNKNVNKISGIIAKIDKEQKTITVINEKITFDQIIHISVVK